MVEEDHGIPLKACIRSEACGTVIESCRSRLCQGYGGRSGEMADAQDLKSWAPNRACGFESRLRHQNL